MENVLYQRRIKTDDGWSIEVTVTEEINCCVVWSEKWGGSEKGTVLVEWFPKDDRDEAIEYGVDQARGVKAEQANDEGEE